MPATYKGIYHNLKESEYAISNSEIAFFFSSKVYLNKFLDRYENHREEFNKRLDRVINDCPLDMSMMADIQLYETIEKRGFRAWLKGSDINKENLYLYALRKMIERNTLNWQRMQKPKLAERLKIMGKQ